MLKFLTKEKESISKRLKPCFYWVLGFFFTVGSWRAVLGSLGATLGKAEVFSVDVEPTFGHFNKDKIMLNKMIVHKYSGVIMMETELHHIKLKGDVLVLRAKNVVPTEKHLLNTINTIREIIPNNKVHLFIDNSNGIVMNKIQRKIFMSNLTEMVDVVVVKNSGWTDKLMYNLIKRFDKPGVNVLLMDSEEQMCQVYPAS